MKPKGPVNVSFYNIMHMSLIETTYDTPKTSTSELAQYKFWTLRSRPVGSLILIKTR